MSKYIKLWNYVKGKDNLTLTFNQIKTILGFDIDHSFLNYKSELEDYVIKISLKNKTITFTKK